MLFDIKKYIINERGVLESADKCNENWKDECLKLKNDEFKIKGIGCTDEIKQRNWLSKEDI